MTSLSGTNLDSRKAGPEGVDSKDGVHSATTTEAKPEVITFTEAFSRALHDAMEMDPAVIMLGEDIADEEGGGIFKVTKGLSTKFGGARVRTTPISE